MKRKTLYGIKEGAPYLCIEANTGRKLVGQCTAADEQRAILKFTNTTPSTYIELTPQSDIQIHKRQITFH
jgi:hypothetical protein